MLDKYFVYISDGYSVYDLVTALPDDDNSTSIIVEYIGGQNRSLYLICKPSQFLVPSLRLYIKQYFRVPLLGKISMNALSKAEKLLKNGDDVLELLVDLFQEEDITAALSSEMVSDVPKEVPDKRSVREYLTSVIAHKESVSTTKGLLSLTNYLSINHIELFQYSDEQVTSRRLSEHDTVKNMLLKGPVLPILNILSAITNSSSISKIDVMQRPRYFYLSKF